MIGSPYRKSLTKDKSLTFNLMFDQLKISHIFAKNLSASLLYFCIITSLLRKPSMKKLYRFCFKFLNDQTC
ncbi:hypothetical protein N186_00865 [Thermofilum adornatum]|uniref:Uncharacterized protein n=1 Tax=Thermofilum adornatum TaxID=1365176 RepID=S5ZJB8_9CREN|nr:hypothetical protein N186_00865 [Thermofilum adornatum]